MNIQNQNNTIEHHTPKKRGRAFGFKVKKPIVEQSSISKVFNAYEALKMKDIETAMKLLGSIQFKDLK